MINLIILTIGIILIILSVIASIIMVKDLEDKCPRWLSYNWPFIFASFIFIIGIGYFCYVIYPYIFMLLTFLKSLMF